MDFSQFLADQERLGALHSYQILDTIEEKDFDELTALAAAICQVPIVLVTLVDEKRQWFKSHHGLTLRETPIEQSFCAHVIAKGELMIVEDAHLDERFQDNPLVTAGPQITYYAGVPLTNKDGHALGTLCVIDPKHKMLSSEQQAALGILARQVMDKLELRRKMIELENSNFLLGRAEEKLQLFNDKLNAMNQHLNQSEERLNLAIASAELGTWYINTLTREFVPSVRLKELFGFLPEEHMPYDAAVDHIAPDYREKVRLKVEQAISQNKAYDLEYPIVGFRDGKRRWVRATGKLYPASKYNAGHFSGTIADITERKLDEQRKNDFISMVSHELKTPLTSINGYLQMLKLKDKQKPDKMITDILAKAGRQVDKMVGMINGFLDVSRLESGKIYIDKSRFDLAELIKEAEEESIASVSSHQVIFAPVEPIIIVADRDKIGQVITNLISNAVKYSPAGSTIKVACVTFGDAAQISVQDEGVGIGAQDMQKLFDRFYRVESQQNEKISGLGIGLYLCAEIIQRHGGKIWVQSAPGQGSTFYFSLPVVPIKY